MTTEFTLTFLCDDEQADKEFRELLKKLVTENPKVKLKIIDETAQQKNPTGQPVAPEYRESDQGGGSEPGGVGPQGGTHTVPDDETRGV
jgi:hypothetical protein